MDIRVSEIIIFVFLLHRTETKRLFDGYQSKTKSKVHAPILRGVCMYGSALRIKASNVYACMQ